MTKTPLPLIRQRVNTRGEEHPSRLASWFYWRDKLTDKHYWDKLSTWNNKSWYRQNTIDIVEFFCQKRNILNNGICPQCDGRLRFCPTDVIGEVWCLCDLPRWSYDLLNIYKDYRSPFTSVTFSEYRVFGDAFQRQYRAEALASCKQFAVKADRWLTLSGPYHIGKTMLLRAIATSYGPLAIYMTIADFSKKMFMALRDETLSDMLTDLSIAPILLLDDLGAEHQADFIQSNLLSVINSRFEDSEEYPLAITTNLTALELRDWGRIGVRLLDDRFGFLQIPSNANSYKEGA